MIQVHRKRIVFDQAAIYLNVIGDMEIDVDAPDRSAILQLPYLARQHRLTSYDAAFLELAIRLRLPLATNDKQPIRAAAESGVPLLSI